ncbi:MAG: ketoacyl-ACP synthase III [Chloroflexota bacterium]
MTEGVRDRPITAEIGYVPWASLRVLGTGSYRPRKILSNADLEQMVETSDSWIVERTGIRERRIAAPEEATSDLAVAAAREALDAAGIAADDLDLIVVGTMTPDSPMPATACIVQEVLGARRAAAFDISSVACAGFTHALGLCGSLLAAGPWRTALVIGAEVLSRVTDWQDRGTCILFGDGAGALVLRRDGDAPAAPFPTVYGSDGGGGPSLTIPAGGSRLPASDETVSGKLHTMRMDGREVFRMAVRYVPPSIQAVVEQAGLTMEDVGHIVCHQANRRIIEAVAKKLDLPLDRFVVNIERLGNTSCASIPLALDECARAGVFQRGEHLVLCGFGGGFAWSSCLITW